MTEHNEELPWVGMDVDAALARYAEDRRAQAETPAAPSPKRPIPSRGLCAALPTLHWEGMPRSPLAA